MRMMIPLVTFLMFVISLNCAFAGVIYDNGVTSIDNGISSSASQPFHSADDFSLDTQQTITDVHWSGISEYQMTDSESFAIKIYEQAVGAALPSELGTEIYSDVVSPVASYSGLFSNEFVDDYYIYDFSAFIDPFVANAGAIYWLEIFNNYIDYNWFWSAQSGGNAAITRFGTDWVPVSFYLDEDYSMDFQLTNNTIPEPSTFLLLGGGLAGLALVVRRRKKE